jgi:hypothetical protein
MESSLARDRLTPISVVPTGLGSECYESGLHCEEVRQLALGLGLNLETPSGAEDFGRIREMARHGFHRPLGWELDPDEVEHYWKDFEPANLFGVLHVIVARNRSTGGLSGYAYYQLRANGDVYLRELAACPPDPADKIRHAGAVLLANSLAHAWDAGQRGLATLCVLETQRRAPLAFEARWRDPVSYYRALGYRIVEAGDVGYTSDGETLAAGSSWLFSGIRDALDATRSRIARRPG